MGLMLRAERIAPGGAMGHTLDRATDPKQKGPSAERPSLKSGGQSELRSSDGKVVAFEDVASSVLNEVC